MSPWLVFVGLVIGFALVWMLPARTTTARGIFSGTRFYFWGIAPFVLLFTVLLLRSWHRFTTAERYGMAVLIVLMWFFLLVLFRPQQFQWGARILAGLFGLACLVSLVVQIFVALRDRKGDATVTMSLVKTGLWSLFFGVPATVFALSGAFPSEHAQREREQAHDDSEPPVV